MLKRFQRLISARFLHGDSSNQKAQRKGPRQDEPARFSGKNEFLDFFAKFLFLLIASGFLLETDGFKFEVPYQFQDGEGQELVAPSNPFVCEEAEEKD